MTHHLTLPDFGKKQWSFGQFKVWVQPQMPSFLLYKPANCLSFPIVGLIDWTMQCLYPAWKCRIYEFCDGIWNSIITEKGSHWGPKGDTLLEKCSRHVTRNNVWSSIPKSLKPRTVNWNMKEGGRWWWWPWQLWFEMPFRKAHVKEDNNDISNPLFLHEILFLNITKPLGSLSKLAELFQNKYPFN